MREVFLERFFEDFQKVIDERACEGDVEYNKRREEQDEAFEDFLSSLTKKQREKFEIYQALLEEERLILEEDLYVHALKKGIAIGTDVARSFK